MMSINRDKLYRFPWTMTDNPGGWIEVTDECNLNCPGCYRHKIEGHRSLEEIKDEVLLCQALTHCDRIGIAGGEPLLYPHLVEVVEFISKHGMKPMLLTNGERLTWDTARELKKAGLAKFHFHVDSGMKRPGWMGKNEAELNVLRQTYADLVWELGGVQCGYNVTVFPATLCYLPDIVDWCQRNIHKVQHISLVAFRSIPLDGKVEYMVHGQKIDPSMFQHSISDMDEIALTTEDMFRVLENHFSSWTPCAYTNGSAFPETYKFLVALNVGSRSRHYGTLGPKTVEICQVFFHLFRGHYFEFLRNPVAGKKLFVLSMFDRELRKSLARFLKAAIVNPLRLLEKIYVQSVSLQQPNEIIDGQANLCDSCVNRMIYRGKLINSCRLDEYRMFGDTLVPVLTEKGKRETPPRAEALRPPKSRGTHAKTIIP
jgi:hypothetical protein